MTATTDTAITYHPTTNTYQLHPDWRADEPVTAAVVRGVATVMNTPPTELQPIYETVDPDALDLVFDSTPGNPESRDISVTFRFNECEVRVHATGTIEITPPDDGNPITSPVPKASRDR